MKDKREKEERRWYFKIREEPLLCLSSLLLTLLFSLLLCLLLRGLLLRHIAMLIAYLSISIANYYLLFKSDKTSTLFT
jgi:hypothetical protein